MTGFERFDLDAFAPPAPEASDPRLDAVFAWLDRAEGAAVPYGWNERAWRRLLRGVRTLALGKQREALAAGWSMQELFGLPGRCAATYGRVSGVVFGLGGTIVDGVEPNRLILRTRDGALQSFWRHAPGLSVAWDRSALPLVLDVDLGR